MSKAKKKSSKKPPRFDVAPGASIVASAEVEDNDEYTKPILPGPQYKTSAQMVADFHRVVVGLRPDVPDGAAAPAVPTAIPDDRLLLRMRLIEEEVCELLCALTGHHGKVEKAYKLQFRAMVDHMWTTRNPMDLIEVADGCIDSHVVISGTALEAGIPEDDCYIEVHRTNMAKAGGPVRDDGKRLKPEGWQPPDIKKVLQNAGWEG